MKSFLLTEHDSELPKYLKEVFIISVWVCLCFCSGPEGPWDLVSHSCLKTIHLLFPCQQPSRIPEHGSFPFLLLSPPLSEQPHLVVGCCDYLALLHLSENRSAGAGGLADRGREGLTCALYNSTLRQLVTGHADSSLSVWDVETGRGRLQILNAHGGEAVTSMALDSSHRRLISGSRSGTIKVH